VDILPKEIARTLIDLPDERLALVGQLRVLLIEVDDPDGPLVQMLRSTSNLDVLVDRGTGVTPTRTLIGSAHRRRPSAAASTLGPAALRETLRSKPHFAIFPMKRSVFDPEARVRIGRSPKADIVLHHASVSTSHAWLDTDEDNVDCLADMGSKNGTRVNDQVLSPSTVTPLFPGDRIAFGSVRAMLALVKTLREALLVDAR
jgi:hypothetical protein